MYILDMNCENRSSLQFFLIHLFVKFECFLFFLILLEVLQNVRVSGLLKCAGFLVNEAVWWRTAVKQLLKEYAEEVEVKRRRWSGGSLLSGMVLLWCRLECSARADYSDLCRPLWVLGFSFSNGVSIELFYFIFLRQDFSVWL